MWWSKKRTQSQYQRIRIRSCIKMLNCSSLNKYILLLVSPSMPVSLDWNLDVESLMCDCCWCCWGTWQQQPAQGRWWTTAKTSIKLSGHCQQISLWFCQLWAPTCWAVTSHTPYYWILFKNYVLVEIMSQQKHILLSDCTYFNNLLN